MERNIKHLLSLKLFQLNWIEWSVHIVVSQYLENTVHIHSTFNCIEKSDDKSSQTVHMITLVSSSQFLQVKYIVFRIVWIVNRAKCVYDQNCLDISQWRRWIVCMCKNFVSNFLFHVNGKRSILRTKDYNSISGCFLLFGCQSEFARKMHKLIPNNALKPSIAWKNRWKMNTCISIMIEHV